VIDMQLKGKAAIVTGSGTGVGRATALKLAAKGCAVLINYSKNKSAAESVCDEVKALGAASLAIRANVADDNDCKTMVAAALETFGRLDILVNNAGTTKFINHNDLDAVTDADWDLVMSVNLRGAFQCTRAARHALQAHGQGCVVNVSSIAGLRAIGSSIPYCASKAALNNLTLSMARVLAPKVRVNAVAPAFIAGEWLREGLGASYESTKRYWENRAVLGKVCEPEDVADAILSLIEGSELVTGQIIPIEGGQMLAI
jgi:3-oxoacyl-[acyl-carrier protein] reductase